MASKGYTLFQVPRGRHKKKGSTAIDFPFNIKNKIMMQIYTLLLKAATIPETRLISWKNFKKSGTSASIKKYVILFLSVNKHKAFSRRDISNMSGIEIGSLTSPLLDLKYDGFIDASGRKVCPETGNTVIAYSWNK